MVITSSEELKERWPEGTLYERKDIRGIKRQELKVIDHVYNVPRKPTELEIVQAAQINRIDLNGKERPLKVTWYLGNPDDLGIEMNPV